MRQAITVTRHQNIWSSSGYSEAEKRGIAFKSAENTNESHAKICYALQWKAHSGFFIIMNTFTSSVPSVDQELYNQSHSALLCSFPCPWLGVMMRKTIYSSTIFTDSKSAERPYHRNTGQAGHQEHGQPSGTEKSLGFGGFRRQAHLQRAECVPTLTCSERM